VKWLLFPVLGALTLVMGCPCCGPRWYGRLHVWACRIEGDPIPPELRQFT
jgi:hypothetical protein